MKFMHTLKIVSKVITLSLLYLSLYSCAGTMVHVAASGNTAHHPVISLDLKQVETDDFVFYFPNGFQSAPREHIAEEEVLYLYGKEGDSINVSRFNFLKGTELSGQHCIYLAQIFNRSEIRTFINTSEATDIRFDYKNGVRSCYYRYSYHLRDKTSYLEYKIYQKGNDRNYALTVIYEEDSPEKETLQKALHSFLIK